MTPDALTIPALLRHRAEHQADLRFVVTDDDAVTYADLDARSREAAAGMVAMGVVKGSRVGVLAPNGVEWAVVSMAVLRLGAVLVPLSTLLRPPELVAQLATASVTHLFHVAEHRGRRYADELATAAPDRADTLPFLRVVETDARCLAPSVDGVVEAMGERVRPADDMAVMFTSGSRGAPKGVLHTHGGAIRATAAGLAVRGIGPEDRVYIPMPFFWMGGFGSGLLSALVAGATVLTETEPEPARTLALLARERATLFRGWPDQAAKLAAHPAYADTDLSSLSDASLGPLLPPDRRPAPGARSNLFGMTETFGPYCADRLDQDMPTDKWGSCGRPLPHVEVRIADPETGEALAPDQPGEIWLRGRDLLRGILGRARHEVFTPDQWFRTGDLGHLDPDGYLWYSGRLDDMVKVKGATVYPSEVEAALRAVPGVRQAYVTDVEGDGGPREIGALVITSAALPEVVAGVKQRLSAFKVPTVWHLTDDLAAAPMMATGKLDKPALQSLLTDKGERP